MLSTEEINECGVAAQHDREMFLKLYDFYYDRLIGYTFKRTLHEQDTYDIVANSFLKVIDKISSYDPSRGDFNSWIYRIVTNEINTYYRKKGKYFITDPEVAQTLQPHKFTVTSTVSDQIDQEIQYLIIHKAIKELAPKYQEVIHLFYFEDMSHKDIASIVGIRVGSVRSRLSRGLKLLKQILLKHAHQFNS